MKSSTNQAAQKTQKLLIVLLVLFALALCSTVWLSTKFLSNQAQNVAVLKAEADVPAMQYQTLLKTKAQLNKLGDISKLLQQALPDGNNQSLIIAEINSIANDNKVSITKLNFVNTTSTTTSSSSKKDANKIVGADIEPISLETGAMSYNQLINFLKQIEKNRWIMQPTTISIQPDQKNPNKIASLNLSINLYVKQGTSKK